ncbi:MAG: nickel pincer cofactor biosynthesis protein LarC [Armatimonadota bacterium]
MKIAYFDCFAGISGDMTLGALIGVGADPEKLCKSLSSLGVDGYTLEVKKIEKNHIAATDVEVVLEHHHHHHRRLGDILAIIDDADLSDWVKEKSSAIFKRLAEAEATVHGSSPEDVHFHEVGAVDAIVDIIGTAICLDLLGRPKIVSSPMPTFHGFATGSHGTFPLPAPATMELLKGVPWRELGAEGELVTPTGAAIITTLSSDFGQMPPMSVETVGYGAGTQDHGFPNVLRVMLGEAVDKKTPADEVSVIQTNIDDLNPQIYDFVMDRLFAMGVLDVFLSPIQMKKNRPGTLLSVICSPELEQKAIEMVLQETSTLGVRIQHMERVCLERQWQEVETEFGKVRIKTGQLNGQVVNASPEYDDCKRAAEEHCMPVKQVYDAAIAAFTGNR